MSAVTTSDDLAATYLAWCRAEHTPANTVKSRARALRLLGDAGTATRLDVELVWAARRGLAPGTRAVDLAGWRSFYKWARRWDHRQDDPTLRIDAPHVPAGLPRPMSSYDLRRALAKFSPDLRRAVCLGAYAGLRVSEAAGLDWAQVDVERRHLNVFGKGGKWRVVAISPILIDELLPICEGNVVNGGGTATSAAVLERKVNRAFRAAAIHATFHQLRHRYGTIGYQATGDLLALGRMMGHASPVTTAVYAEASDDVSAKIATAVVR